MVRLCHAGAGKKRKTCIAGNAIRQAITFKYSPTSTSFTFLKPLPGSTHDITAIRIAGLFGYMQPWHHVADEGYVGLGRNTPFKRRPGKPLLQWQKRFN